MEGHCGTVPGLNADNWLEDRINEFKARKTLERESSSGDCKE